MITSHRFTRRRFLTVTTTTALAIQFVPRRVFGANARVHLAGIGVGGKGRGEINDAAAEGCHIVALCDVDENRALPTFEKFPNAKRYTDFRVMLEKQKDIDAVTVSTKNEDYEWLAAIRGDGPAPLSNFAISGPFTETVLLGNVAIRTGQKLLWDGEKMRATNAPAADQYLRRDYRKGWEI